MVVKHLGSVAILIIIFATDKKSIALLHVSAQQGRITIFFNYWSYTWFHSWHL